jgi:5-methylcytosine-specific restriction protein B
VEVCCFHPAFGYEDFMEGYRPERAAAGLAFERRDGLFKALCRRAAATPRRPFYLVIDEINRGDIPRIFGELLTVIERGRRGRALTLPLSGERFAVPPNVFLIGTMNTADRSIALLDAALRRRLGFVELLPDGAALAGADVDGLPLGPWLDALNARLRRHLGRDARSLQIGHAYLMHDGAPIADAGALRAALQDDILPLLEEYCYDDPAALEAIVGPALFDHEAQRFDERLFTPDGDEALGAALRAMLAPETP